MTNGRPVNPAALGAPKGFSHGWLVPQGRLLFVAGQVASDGPAGIIGIDLPTQFGKALENVLAVVAEAGGRPVDIARLTIYVLDKRAYLAARRVIGDVYRARMGKHFPAMTLVEVSGLVDAGALVEIEAVAVIP